MQVSFISRGKKWTDDNLHAILQQRKMFKKNIPELTSCHFSVLDYLHIARAIL